MVVIIVENCCSVDVICSTILFLIIQITLIDKPFFISVVVAISVVMRPLDVRICVVVGISVDVASPIIKDNNHSVYYKSRSTNISFYKSFYVIITNSSSFYRFICYLNLSFLYLSKLF
jgi:hypothetical protein